jgi:hypothetical protein
MIAMNSRVLSVRAGVTVIGLSALSLLSAVPSLSQPGDVTPDSLGNLHRVLEKRESDLGRLEQMYQALNEVDTTYKSRYPTWVVLDNEMSERIRRSFRVRKINHNPDAEVQVISNPLNGEILEISVGDAKMGRIDTRTFLSDSLHEAILDEGYDRRMVSADHREERIGQLYGMRPRFAAAYGSAFGAGLLISNGWGVEGKMGFEEIGYHFWTTGSVRGLAVFDRFKIGAVIPIALGTSDASTQPLDIRPRKMTGAIGFSSEVLLPWDDQSVNALLSVADVPTITNLKLLADSIDFYFLHTVAQASYSKHFLLKPGQELTLSGGLGFHQMASATLNSDGSVQTTEKEDFISPIVRVEYVNRLGNMFGMSAQLYSSVLYLKGWVEIVRNLLYIDLQYYSPVFRDPRPWEQSYFFMVSPRIQVIF